jgi:two-component system response regulator FixJ
MNMPNTSQFVLDLEGGRDETETVFVIDDDTALPETYASAGAFLDAWRPDREGCLVLDIGLPGMDGIALQRALHARAVRLPIIFLTGHGDVPTAVQAVKEGAVDFLEKPAGHDVILERIRAALEAGRKRRFEERVGTELLERYQSLTPRQREIMTLVTSGLANKEVARKLDISTRTVEGHRFRIMEKMRATSLWELTEMAKACEVLNKAATDKDD